MGHLWDGGSNLQIEAQQTQQEKRNTTVEEKWKQFNFKK